MYIYKENHKMNFEDVRDFHEKFELPCGKIAAVLEPEAFVFRSNFMGEELKEFVQARIDNNLVGAVDSLLDLVYVACGTALFVGDPGDRWKKTTYADIVFSTPAVAPVYFSAPHFLPEELHHFFTSTLESRIEGFTRMHYAAVKNETGALLLQLEVLRGIVSTCYVAAAFMSTPWEDCWNHVQRANMSKLRAKPDGSDSKRGTKLDVVKPAGWKAPDAAIARELMNRGWTMPHHLIETAEGKILVKEAA